MRPIAVHIADPGATGGDDIDSMLAAYADAYQGSTDTAEAHKKYALKHRLKGGLAPPLSLPMFRHVMNEQLN